MNKFLLSYAIFTMSTVVSYAQIKLNGSYIATKICYLNDEELPEDNALKYAYVKYTFSNSDQISWSGVYFDRGTPFPFVIDGKRLIVKSEAGYMINIMKIMESTAEKLVLVCSSENGSLEDPLAIKYTLYNEQFVQKNLPLSPDDVFSIKEKDTIYKSGQKIYAKFHGTSFRSYIYEKLLKRNIYAKSRQLLSTFIIEANGHPDSLKIIQGISPKFDAEYIKAFNSAKFKLEPAYHNNNAVRVWMNQDLKYSSLTPEQTLPSYSNSQKANTAYNNKNYELALYYYDKALDITPDEVDNLYRRGICKQRLGNLMGACADWTKTQLLGNKMANALLFKYCN